MYETVEYNWLGYAKKALYVIVPLLILWIINPFTIVPSSHIGIVQRWGAPVREIVPGLHVRIPFAESVRLVDVSTQKEQVEASAASKDLQTVNAMIAVNYNVDPSHVTWVWTTFRGNEGENVIAPAVQEAVKASTAKYSAEELITKRELIKSDIQQLLKARLAEAKIIVTNVSIVNFNFSGGFNKAIEDKVKAEQEALKAKNDLERVKFEAEQKIAQAQAEAEAIRLSSNAANNSRYVELKQLEVQLEFAKKWNGILPVNLYGSAPIPFLDLTK